MRKLMIDRLVKDLGDLAFRDGLRNYSQVRELERISGDIGAGDFERMSESACKDRARHLLEQLSDEVLIMIFEQSVRWQAR